MEIIQQLRRREGLDTADASALLQFLQEQTTPILSLRNAVPLIMVALVTAASMGRLWWMPPVKAGIFHVLTSTSNDVLIYSY